MVKSIQICMNWISLSPQYNMLAHVREELANYIEETMRSNSYIFELILPLENISYFNLIDEEVVKLPFGMFSVNLWEKLLEDKENPVFKVLSYFEDCIHILRSNLGIGKYEVIVLDSLNKRGIIDVYSLHSYVGVFENISNYFEGENLW